MCKKLPCYTGDAANAVPRRQGDEIEHRRALRLGAPFCDLGRKERLCQVQLADGRQAATLRTSSCTARVQASQSQAAKAALGTSALASPTAR